MSQASFVVGPPPDAIAEFRVETNSMSAEYGRSGGAVLNVNIKSVTNALHGRRTNSFATAPWMPRITTILATSPYQLLNKINLDSAWVDPWYCQRYITATIRLFFLDYQGTRIRSSETFLANTRRPGAPAISVDFKPFLIRRRLLLTPTERPPELHFQAIRFLRRVSTRSRRPLLISSLYRTYPEVSQRLGSETIT